MSLQESNKLHAPVDFRSLDYVDHVNHNLICPICRSPFTRPRRLACDHTFCEQCLHKAFKSSVKDWETICPLCRRRISFSDGAPLPRFLTAMIDDYKVRCPNYPAGCNVNPRRGDVQAHVDLYCEFAEVDCPTLSCHRTIIRHQFSAYCCHVTACCKSCHLQMMVKDLPWHQKYQCTQGVQCCYQCHNMVKPYAFQNHLKSCVKSMQNCTGQMLGCNFTGSGEDVIKHTSICPLAILQPFLDRMSHRMNAQGATIQDHSHKLEILEGTQEQGSHFSALEVMGHMQSRDQSVICSITPPQPPQDSPARSYEAPYIDSTVKHLLSLHESLRMELDRIAASISELDARSSIMIMNESIRTKEDMAHLNAAIGSLRVQLQWLSSSRLQSQTYSIASGSTSQRLESRFVSRVNASAQLQPVRRLSDSIGKETKL